MSFRILPSSGLLRDVRWFETDVSGLPIGPNFKGQACILEMGPMFSPETSISNPLTPRNNPEDGRIRFYRSGSFQSRIINIHHIHMYDYLHSSEVKVPYYGRFYGKDIFIPHVDVVRQRPVRNCCG